MEKKKILIVNIGTNLGGIESSLKTFCKTLNVLNFASPTLATWKPAGPMMPLISPFIEKSITLGVGTLQTLIKQRGQLRSFFRYVEFKIRQLLNIDEWKACKPLPELYEIAICYCQNGYSPYFVIDKVKATKKVLWYHHGSYEKQGQAKQKDLAYYLKYDKIVTVSETNKVMLLSHFPELAEKIIVIKNIIDREDIVRKSQQKLDAHKMPGVCNIVTVGRIAPEKGQTFALKIAKELKERGFKYHWFFIGDGPDWEHCHTLLKEYQIAHLCSFVGAQPNPYPYMEMADLYVQASFVEADPVTISEAKVLKKTIIASDLPATREVLDNGELGVLCHTDATAFALSIINTSYDKQLRRKFYENLSHLDDENCNQENQIIQLLS